MSGFVNFGVRASQKTYAFNFTGGTLDGATFARSSTSTYLSDSTGFITDAAIDEARWERKIGTLCLLVEPQRTNYVKYSQAMNYPDTGWFVDGTGITAVTGQTAPDGSTNASLAQRGGAGTGIYGQTNVPNGVVCTSSVFAKSDTAGARVRTFGYSGFTGNLSHNLSSDYDRYEANVTSTSASNLIVYDDDYTNKPLTWWGSQVEVGDSATSYIPTTTTAVTRAQDQLTVDVPVGETTLQLTFDDDSTQNIDVTADAGATHTIDPDVLNRFHIKYGDFV